DINGQLPKKRYKKKRQEEMMANDEYETKKAEFFKQAKEEAEKDKAEKEKGNQQIPVQDKKNYAYPMGKYDNRPYEPQLNQNYLNYGGYQKHPNASNGQNPSKPSGNYDYLNKYYDHNMNKINEERKYVKPAQPDYGIKYPPEKDNKPNYNYKDYKADIKNIYGGAPKAAAPKKVDKIDYGDLEARLNKMKKEQKKPPTPTKENDINKLIDYSSKNPDNHKNEYLYGDNYKPKEVKPNIYDVNKNFNYPGYQGLGDHYKKPSNKILDNGGNDYDNLKYKYQNPLRQDPIPIRKKSPPRVIQSSNANARPDPKKKDRYRNLFEDPAQSRLPGANPLPKPNNPIKANDYKSHQPKPSANSRPYSAKLGRDVGQIYNAPNQMYVGRDKGHMAIRESPSNKLYGGIGYNNPNLNYQKGKINRPASGVPRGGNVMFGYKKAPAKNVEIRKLDYNKYMQGLRGNDKVYVHGNKDELYRAMGFQPGYQGPKIVSHKK
ncbi:MAG: hypothetical protein MJ252_23075, partial [archaeon]|nr:hypothetical protein [archaeon]